MLCDHGAKIHRHCASRLVAAQDSQIFLEYVTAISSTYQVHITLVEFLALAKYTHLAFLETGFFQAGGTMRC